MTTPLTPQNLSATRLYGDLAMLALKEVAYAETPQERDAAREWLESNDDGLGALNTACRHLANTTEMSPAPESLASIPRTPENWKAAIQAAYHDGGDRAIQAVDNDLKTLIASHAAPTEPDAEHSLEAEKESVMDQASVQDYQGPTHGPGF